jgi:hypothetical protein
MESDNLKIYIPYFRKFPIPESENIIPLACGDFQDHSISINTKTGDNINHLNPYWNEYTSLYWIIKNQTLPKKVGFMHYRKFFAIELQSSNRWQPVYRTNPTQEILNQLCSTAAVRRYERTLDSHDIIVPRGYHLNLSIKDQYTNSHGEEEWNQFELAIANVLPEYKQHLPFFYETNYFIFFGMMITHREFFLRYVSQVVCVLNELLRMRMPNIKSDEAARFRHHRYPAYLGERFFMLFLHANSLRRFECPVVLLESTA